MVKKKVILSSIVALVICGANLFGSEKVLATVGGETITQAEADTILKAQRITFNQLKAEDKKNVINQLIDRKVLANSAYKTNVINTPIYKETLEKLKKDLALQLWMSDLAKTIVVSEATTKSYYEKNKNKFKKPLELKANHILLKTEQEAKSIIDTLLKSKNLKIDFVKMAKNKSTDPAGANGGDLGWFTMDKMIPEFSMAASSLKIGSMTSKPVKTKYGYHIIYLDGKKEPTALGYNEVKEDIKQFLSSEEFNTKIENILKIEKAKAKIIIK